MLFQRKYSWRGHHFLCLASVDLLFWRLLNYLFVEIVSVRNVISTLHEIFFRAELDQVGVKHYALLKVPSASVLVPPLE